jgi:hypothetical protein
MTSEHGRHSLIWFLIATESKVSAQSGVSIWRTNRLSVHGTVALDWDSVFLLCVFVVVIGCTVRPLCGFVEVWFIGEAATDAYDLICFPLLLSAVLWFVVRVSIFAIS